MKTIEHHNGNNWLDKLLNGFPMLLDTEHVHTLFAFAFCRASGRWTFMYGDLGGSLFMNGTLFVRYIVTPLTSLVCAVAAFLVVFVGPWWMLLLTYGLFVHISWRQTGNRRYWQGGWGHKLNGRIAILFRIPQNDAKAAAGVNGPNYGQASGWDCGTK